jgi:hypothetical protein
MASAAKFVDWFFEHKLLISGMGIMTDDTARSKNNPVHILHPLLFFFSNQVLLIAVTDDAECQ